MLDHSTLGPRECLTPAPKRILRAKGLILTDIFTAHAPDKMGTRETMERVWVALDRLADLRAKGMRIIPALTAGEDVKKPFEEAERALLPFPPAPKELTAKAGEKS